MLKAQRDSVIGRSGSEDHQELRRIVAANGRVVYQGGSRPPLLQPGRVGEGHEGRRGHIIPGLIRPAMAGEPKVLPPKILLREQHCD